MVDTRRSKDVRRPSPRDAGRRVQSGTVYTLSEQETIDLGHSLAGGLQGGELILLDGDLGLGKTALARGIAAGLGFAPEDVSSPSFTMIQEYKGGRTPMFHVDLYRISDVEELETLGLEEIIASGAVVVVEWGERLPPYHRRGAITIRLYDLGEGSRRIELGLPDGTPKKRDGDA